MENCILNEALVSLEQATRLKALGFPQMQGVYYSVTDEAVAVNNECHKVKRGDTIISHYFSYSLSDFVFAPTLSLVQQWLRDVKKIHISMISEQNREGWTFAYRVCPLMKLYNLGSITQPGFLASDFNEALSGGIDVALDILSGTISL